MSSKASMPQIRTWLSEKSHAEKLFVAALAAYIFFYLPSLAAYRGAESLMLLAFFWLVFVSGRKNGIRYLVLRDPFLLTCVAMLGFLLLARLWYAYSLPPGIDPETRETRYVLKPFIVFIIAFGMGIVARPYRWALLLLGALGLLIYLLTTIGDGYWTMALNGRREDFGIHNAQHTAMFTGTALIASVCFMARAVRISTPFLRRAVMTFVAITFTTSACVFIAAQTRAAWLGIFMASTIGLVTIACLARTKRGKPQRRTMLVPAILILSGIMIAGINAPERVIASFSDQEISLEQYASLPEYNANPRSSHGVRLLSWRMALEWLKERPLLGWGPGSAEDLIDQSEYFSDQFKKTFGHLHSSLVESLVANGLIGTAILLVMVIWVGSATFIAHRNREMPDDVFVFALSFFGFWVAINFFESYTLYTTGHYINAVVAGFIYSFYLQSHREDVSS
ncbi:O-antigen ligase family protein [Marinobacter metalliresistant]|uniref:O-antigen ligase family protein n=1 Tax=Marinobacter metalliresistant TaxID=2961995 RepID=A0ABZ2VZK8_9GAMM